MRTLATAASVVLIGTAVAGCGGGKSSPPATTTTPPKPAKSAASSFSVASVSGVGKVVVDGKGRTVYILTSGSKKNVPCTDDSGCTKVWPDLSLPDGTTAAKAGDGIQASLLGTQRVGDETYPTYGGYLLYEYSGDSGKAQGNGQGIRSYGGTWYAVSPEGKPIGAPQK